MSRNALQTKALALRAVLVARSGFLLGFLTCAGIFCWQNLGLRLGRFRSRVGISFSCSPLSIVIFGDAETHAGNPKRRRGSSERAPYFRWAHALYGITGCNAGDSSF